MSVIEASSTACKTMADGTLRITVDVEPRHAQAAFLLFGAPGVPMALARLQAPAPEPEPEPERLKGGAAAKWLGIMCGDGEFQVWLRGKFPGEWTASGQLDSNVSRRAASVIRAVCSVESRAEIDNDEAANERFQRLIRGPWIKHQGARA